MNFLHRNKKGLNTKMFSEADYVVLNYEQLLKVNGAGGGSGGGGGGGGPSGPSGTSGNTTTIIGDYPSGYGACGGGRYVVDTPSSDNNSSNNSSSKPTTSSYSSCGGGGNNTTTSSSKDYSSESNPKDTTPKYYDDTGKETNNPYEITGKNVGESALTAKDILQPIAQASVDNKDKYGDGNTCDEFAAKTLSSGGYNPNDYYLGNTEEKVIEHINEMKKSGIDYSEPSSDANIVFMGDGHNDYTRGHEHAGMLFIEKDGSCSFYHASSNNPNQYNIKETYSSVEAFEKDFGYDSFYYQGIR